MVAVVVLAYGLIAALELPPLWRKPAMAGERHAVWLLLVAGLLYGLAAMGPFAPASVWPVIEVVFRPIGAPFFPE